jgi:hypothetical protein
MFLDYLALVILVLGLLLVFYGFIYIHDLPHKIAKARQHPHEEAIHVACWLSLFTLHAIWPLVYIWAVSHRQGRPSIVPTVAVRHEGEGELARRLAELEARLQAMEGGRQPAGTHSEVAK